MTTKKHLVILPGNWPGDFHRTIRKVDEEGTPKDVLDEAGNPRVLTFHPGQVAELTTEELEAVRDDVGTALHIAKLDDGSKDKKLVGKIDSKATREFVEETRKQRQADAEGTKARKAGKPAPAKASSTAHSAADKKDLEHKAK